MHRGGPLQNYAPSGLTMTPSLRWGSHLGHFFGSAGELEEALVPYFKAGLENNEACLWVTRAPFDAAKVRAALNAVMPDLPDREDRGQIQFVNGSSFYRTGEPIAAADLVDDLRRREQAALAAGFSGLRTAGNCGWADYRCWPDFLRYESLVHEAVHGRRMICLCSYEPAKLQGPQIIDLVNRHHLMLREGAHAIADAPISRNEMAEPAAFQTDIDAIGTIEAVPMLLQIIARITGMGFVAVARVTGERWICLSAHDEIGFGLEPGGELKIETTICHEIWQTRRGVVINHVAEDALYRDHHTPAAYGFQSYISLPIILRDGSFYGTLCAIDPGPAEIDTPEILGMFRAFADLIAFHLEAQGQLADAQASLLDARAAAELNEQFVAVLGHDLRNPIAAIAAGTQLLGQEPLGERGRFVVDGIARSAARMSILVDNIIDLARGRLGGGLVLQRSTGALRASLLHVINELQIAHSDRLIKADLAAMDNVEVDFGYVARLLSNLLSNALKYGASDEPVFVSATADESFELSVVNSGPAIRPEIMERLFVPFARGDVRPDQQGLGLGLYIVSEIARAHGGEVIVTSDETETRFTFRMPLL